MDLYVDDVRPGPFGWFVVRTIEEAKEFLKMGLVEFLSLDHDMGACADCTAAGTHIGDMQSPATTFYNTCPHAQTGTDLVKWMIDTGHWSKMKPMVHSMNPVGAERMRGMIDRYFSEGE